MLKMICFLIVCVAILLTACNNSVCEGNTGKKTESCEPHTESDNPHMEQEPQEVRGGINHGVIDPYPLDVDFTLVYDGTPIVLTYMLHNGEREDEWGLSLFINGVQHPFYVGDFIESTPMYVASYEADEKKEVDISFIPKIGSIGDVLSVSFVVMLNPSFVILDSEEFRSFGNNHAITQMPWNLFLEKEPAVQVNDIFTGGNNELPSENFLERYVVETENGILENMLDTSVHFEFYQDGFWETDIFVNKDDNTLAFTIKAAGQFGESPEINAFRISLYTDHQLINAFDGNRYLDMTIEEGMVTSFDFELESHLLLDKNHIYIIVTPLADDVAIHNPPIVKTASMPIVTI
ncbi:MAG: hypothetical protein FWF76_00835 [Oscillospiraceae bacterium]|nr:hypothetical protein [Oscillospiraceae bacterium]